MTLAMINLFITITTGNVDGRGNKGEGGDKCSESNMMSKMCHVKRSGVLLLLDLFCLLFTPGYKKLTFSKIVLLYNSIVLSNFDFVL